MNAGPDLVDKEETKGSEETHVQSATQTGDKWRRGTLLLIPIRDRLTCEGAAEENTHGSVKRITAAKAMLRFLLVNYLVTVQPSTCVILHQISNTAPMC